MKKILFDTSVIVAALVEAHPKHERALPWLIKAVEKKEACYLCAHSLAEIYAVFTTLPLSPRISSSVAFNLIETNIKKYFNIVTLSAQDYWKLIHSFAEQGLMGGVIYDGLICQTTEKIEFDMILTFNQKDFKRLLNNTELLVTP